MYDKVEEAKGAQQCKQLSMQLKSKTDRIGLHTTSYSNIEPHEEQAGWKASEMELNCETPYPTLDCRRVKESTDELEPFYDDIVQQTSYLTDKPVVQWPS